MSTLTTKDRRLAFILGIIVGSLVMLGLVILDHLA